MPRFQHPLLSAAYANIPKEQREELACCCLNGCTGLLEGRWLGDAWKKVEEQAAEGSSSSSSGSSRYTAGKYDLGTDPLFPTFTEQASRKHGLWACNACVRSRARECQRKAAAAATEAAIQLPETNPETIFPLGLISSQPSPQPSSTPPTHPDQAQQQQQQPPPQQQVLIRHAKDARIADLEAKATQQSAELKGLVANIAERSADRQTAAAAKADLEHELSRVQEQLASSKAELQALRQAAQRHLEARPGGEIEAIRRAPGYLEAAKQRGQEHRSAATAAKAEQRSTQAQLDALEKSIAAQMKKLVQQAEGATKALADKSEEAEQQERKAAALEEDLQAAAAQQVSMQKLQQQIQQLRKRYKKVNAANNNLRKQWEVAEQQLAAAAQPASQAQAPAAQPPSQPAPAAQPPIAQAPALPIASSSAPPQVSEAASAPSGRGRSGRRGRSRGTRGRGGGRIVSEPTPPATTSTTAAAAAAAAPSSSSAAQQLGEAGVSSSRANSSPPPSTLHRACFLTPQARQALPPAASTKVTASDLPNAMDEEEGLGADFVLHTDGQGEGVLELQQVEDDELGEEGMVRKRRKLDRPLSFARAVMQQMEAVRARGAAEIDPQVEHEPAAATFTATQEQIEQTVEGEMTGEQWAKEIQLRTSIYFQHLAGYLRSQGSSMLSTLPNQYRIASYWDAEAKGEEGGFGAFQLDSHLCSEATGRACPPSCPHCSKQPPTPKWTRAQHLENTAHSMGFFDRQDHKPAIHSALQQGQLEPVTCAEQHSIGGYSLHSTLDLWHLQYLFGTTHSMETERTINKVRMSRGIHTSNMTQQRQFLAVSGTKDQLQVTGSTWRQWCKEANEQAAARKVGMMGSGFASVLQAALSKVQASSGRGRRKWAEPGAAEQAKQAAQRREQDPAAKRMRLVQNMRYLSLKRAALLGFMQEEPASSMSAEQQRQEMDAVPKLNLAEVTAQLLDTRWSTKQLETAAAAAQAAAKEISNEKRQARAEKQGAQQQQQQQQQQDQVEEQEQEQQQQQQSEMQPAGQLCLPRSCNLAKTTSIYMESSSSESSSCSSESAEDASSSDSDWL